MQEGGGGGRGGRVRDGEKAPAIKKPPQKTLISQLKHSQDRQQETDNRQQTTDRQKTTNRQQTDNKQTTSGSIIKL